MRKPANNDDSPSSAEPVERRASAEENPNCQAVTGAPYPEAAWSWRERIRRAAKGDRKLRFTSLLHHMTPGLLYEAFHALRRQAAVGIDGVDWDAYADGVYARLADLHERVQSGRYRAQPAKRAWIPKGDGGRRPLGIPVLEDSREAVDRRPIQVETVSAHSASKCITLELIDRARPHRFVSGTS